MFDIGEIELRRLDLTVLLVFVNLMRLRKATDVAEHMGLTQSSISHSIKRLRDVFGDPLFLRTPRGMEPTAYASALEPRIAEIVQKLSEAMAQPFVFAPKDATGVFRIGAYDNEMTTLVPNLIKDVKREAPGLKISVLPIGRRTALDALKNRNIDLALGLIWDLPGEYISQTLYQESYQVVCRKKHRQADKIGTLDTYCELEHLVVSPAGDFDGIVDQELSKQARARNVVATLPLFLPALALVAQSDLIATLPKRLVEQHAATFKLHQAEPPIAIRPFAVSAIRHRRNERNPLHDWIIGKLKLNYC